MFHRLLLLAVLFVVSGCCGPICDPCPRRCCPCPKRLDPGQKTPPLYEEPPSHPPGQSDRNCATWNNPECPNGMSRPGMLNLIKNAADAAHNLATPTITDDQYQAVITHYNKYMLDQNCLGNFNNGAGDCCPPGTSNCNCIQMALGAAVSGQWANCNVRLGQGH